MKALALVCLLALGAPEPSAPDIRRYGGRVPGATPEDVAVVQVVDAATGNPVAGARVLQYEENGGNGFLSAALLAETRTDAFGLASIRWTTEKHDCHWVFDAPGYAVIEEYGEMPPDRVWLERGGSMAARLLGPFGMPVAGADVELYLGCGHSPAVRRARTGPDGRFRFDGVRPGYGYLWFNVPGLASRSIEMDDVLAAGDGATIVADPGYVATGRLVDAKGEPVPDVVVGITNASRGPATVTGPRGEFRLVGAAFDEGFHAHHERFRGLEASFWPGLVAPERGPVRVVMPDGGASPSGPLEMLGVEGVTVPVRTLDAATGKTVESFESFRLRNLADGLVYDPEPETDDEDEETGRLVVIVPPGEYEVVPEGPFSERRPVPARVTIAPDRKELLEIVAERRPRLRIDGRLPDRSDHPGLDLVVPVGVAGIEDDLANFEDEPLFLPAEGPAVLRVRADGIVRLFRVGPAKDGTRSVTIDWPEPKTVRVPLPPDLMIELEQTGFDDSITLGQFAFEASRDGGDLVLRTQATGRAVLVIEAENDRTASLVVEVPAEPGATIRTKAPTWHEPGGEVGPLRLIGPDGKPLAGVEVAVVRDGNRTWGKTEEDGTFASRGFSGSVRHGGWWDSEVARREFAAPPAFLEVKGWTTRLLRAERPGPLEVRYPAGVVNVQVREPDGDPVPFTVLVDGLSAGSGEGRHAVRGVPPGRRLILVGTVNHGARLAVVTVPERGAARLDLVLPRED